MKRFLIGGAFLALLLATASAASAPSITNLGKQMNVVSPYPYFPLGGFHRMKTVLRSGGKTDVLFLGTMAQFQSRGWPVVDATSPGERWPVVKALAQFGTFAGVRKAPQPCDPSFINPDEKACLIASFDWSHATYRSRYITFVHKDLLDTRARRFQTMSKTERTLYYKYSRNAHPALPMSTRQPGTPYYRDDPDYVVTTTFFSSMSIPGRESTRRLPLVVVGNYEQTTSQITIQGEYQRTIFPKVAPGPTTPIPTESTGMSFTQVHNALLRGREPFATSDLVLYVNAEANIITALICHADGKRPASVCGTPAIRSILKHVK